MQLLVAVVEGDDVAASDSEVCGLARFLWYSSHAVLVTAAATGDGRAFSASTSAANTQTTTARGRSLATNRRRRLRRLAFGRQQRGVWDLRTLENRKLEGGGSRGCVELVVDS